MLSFNKSGDAQAALTGGEAEALAGARRLRATAVTAALAPVRSEGLFTAPNTARH